MDDDDFDEFESITSFAPKTLPPAPSPLPADPYEHAVAAYHLLDPPRDGVDWSAYLDARAAADKQMKRIASSFDSGDSDMYLRVVRNAVHAVLQNALPGGQWEKVARGVVVTDLESQGDGDYNIADSAIVTRIHSPISASSVDLRFVYTFSQGYTSVAWRYALGMRLNPSPRAPQSLRSREHCLASDMNRKDGWQRVVWYCLYEPKDTRRSGWDALAYEDAGMEYPGTPPGDEERSKFEMKPEDLRAAHELLFGRNTELSRRISKKDTLRLLLAAVGMPFHIATHEGEKDGCEGVIDEVNFRLGGEKPGTTAADLRRVLGVPTLAGDTGMRGKAP